MIRLAGAAVATAIPIATAALAAAKSGPVVSVPTVWRVLGYDFEAGSMIAALVACVAVRFYVVQQDRAAHRWTVDLPVSALSIMFTAAAAIRLRPDPAWALMLGTGFGALGAGIITIALANIQRILGGGSVGGSANGKDLT